MRVLIRWMLAPYESPDSPSRSPCSSAHSHPVAKVARNWHTGSSGSGNSDNPTKEKELENMDIRRSGSQPSGKGPADYFTGTVRVDPLFEPQGPARALGASVTFEPGARTAWHVHPLGQNLIVTA